MSPVVLIPLAGPTAPPAQAEALGSPSLEFQAAIDIALSDGAPLSTGIQPGMSTKPAASLGGPVVAALVTSADAPNLLPVAAPQSPAAAPQGVGDQSPRSPSSFGEANVAIAAEAIQVAPAASSNIEATLTDEEATSSTGTRDDGLANDQAELPIQQLADLGAPAPATVDSPIKVASQPARGHALSSEPSPDTRDVDSGDAHDQPTVAPPPQSIPLIDTAPRVSAPTAAPRRVKAADTQDGTSTPSAPAASAAGPGPTGTPVQSTSVDPVASNPFSAPADDAVHVADARHEPAASHRPASTLTPSVENKPSEALGTTGADTPFAQEVMQTGTGQPGAPIVRDLAGPAAAPMAQPHVKVIAAQHPQFGYEMGVEIARSATAGDKELTVRLHPLEMGRIEVKLSFDDRGSLRALVAAENPAALDILRRDSADLSRALSDAGVRSDSQSFRFDARAGGGEGGQLWQRQQQAGQQHRRAYTGSSSNGESPVYRPLRTSGQVDLMA